VSGPELRDAWQAIADVCALVEGVAVVMGANDGTAAAPQVVPIADEILDWPAIVLVPGPWQNIAGGAARFTVNWLGSIYVPREAPGDGSVILLDTFQRLLEVVAAHSKAGATDPVLQYVLLTEGPGLSNERWPNRDDGQPYLTWPFELEVKFNPNTLTYSPA
jgi:hypothetical protein